MLGYGLHVLPGLRLAVLLAHEQIIERGKTFRALEIGGLPRKPRPLIVSARPFSRLAGKGALDLSRCRAPECVLVKPGIPGRKPFVEQI